MIRVRGASGGAKLAKRLRFRAIGALKDVSAIRLRTAAGVKTAWSSISGSISPGYVQGSVFSAQTRPVATSVAVVSVEGGSAPFTYSWPAVAGWNVIPVTSDYRQVYFMRGVAPGAEHSATFTCNVTDAAGAVVSDTVDANVANYGDNP